jgi:hypothetical protein
MGMGTRFWVAATLVASLVAAGCGGGTPSGSTSPAAAKKTPGGGGSSGGGSTGGTTGGSTGGSSGGSSGGSIAPGPTASSFKADQAITAGEAIWHVDFDTFAMNVFDNMVGHGLAVQSLGPSAPINTAVKDKLVGVVLQRVNTAYLRNPDGTKKAGQSFKITFVAVVPTNDQRFAGGPGVSYSRICLGSRESKCMSGTLGVETLDPGNQSMEYACQLNALGTFMGRICGVNSVLNGQVSTAPLTANDLKFVNGQYKLGQGTAAEDDRMKAISDVIADWGTAIGNVVAHEIGHSVGLDHDNSTRGIMLAVGTPQDFSDPNIAFSPRSQATLKQTLGIQP